jgi:protein-L-isoaspartate O-methyltransferase
MYKMMRNRNTAASLCVIAVCALGTFPLRAQRPDSLAPYLPTPQVIVDKMLELGKLRAGERMYDLGSGDGRIVIAAARKKASAVGIELDDAIAASSAARLIQLGLEKTARIVHGDLLQQDYSSADLITVYLWPEANLKVRGLLDLQLRKGARVVAHDFEIGGWTPTQTVTVPDDGTGRSHTLFLYIK